MKIKTLLALFSLILFFACDPKGNNQTAGDEKQTTPNPTGETEKTPPPPPMTDTREETPKKEGSEKATTTPASPSVKPDHYICYHNDAKPSMAMAIAFDVDENALSVKYKGQKESMVLKYLKEEASTGGSYPTIETYYTEMYEGKENGVYKLTHSGNWDYAEYTRKRDGKKFNFTIDQELTDGGNGYRTSPCY